MSSSGDQWGNVMWVGVGNGVGEARCVQSLASFLVCSRHDVGRCWKKNHGGVVGGRQSPFKRVTHMCVVFRAKMPPDRQGRSSESRVGRC